MAVTEPRQFENIEPNVTKHVYYEYSVKDKSYVPMHWHDAIEAILLLDGELLVETDGRKIDMHEDDLMILSFDEMHSTTSTTGNTAILLQYPYRNITRDFDFTRNLQIVFDPATEIPEQRQVILRIKQMMREMYFLEKEKPFGWSMKFDIDNLRIVYLILTTFSVPVSEAEHRGSARNRERLGAVIAYTEAHYSEQISLEEVANVVHLQKNYFCRLFRDTMGMTYLDYLSEVRISKIYHDLISTDQPLADLLDKHGFTNYKLFRSKFGARFGMTPGEVRKKQAVQEDMATGTME